MQAAPDHEPHILNLPDTVFGAVFGNLKDPNNDKWRGNMLFWVCKDTRRHVLINTTKLSAGITNDYAAGLVHTSAGSGQLKTLTVSGRSQSSAVHKLLQLGAAASESARAYGIAVLNVEVILRAHVFAWPACQFCMCAWRLHSKSETTQIYACTQG